MKLTKVLSNTIKEHYAVGSFSPRYVKMIKPVLEAMQEMDSPGIVQISSKELTKYGITPKEFADEFFYQKDSLHITVPVTLHLDHTYTFDVIQEAIEAGFESVMIDASAKDYEDNIDLTRKVVEYAHERNVDVEAELGKIGSNDQIETDGDDSYLYTVPEEAEAFVDATGVDALAASVGTAHGVYTVKKPDVQFDIIKDIHKLTPVYLVLHGGSGVPAQMVIDAYKLEGGGISKVNIATDLELAFLGAIGEKERGTNAWCNELNQAALEIGRQAVKEEVKKKIKEYLHSDCKAEGFR